VARVDADETLVGGARPGRPGRGAAGKAALADAVEAAPGEGRKRRLGLLPLQAVPDALVASLKASSQFRGLAGSAPRSGDYLDGAAIRRWCGSAYETATNRVNLMIASSTIKGKCERSMPIRTCKCPCKRAFCSISQYKISLLLKMFHT
jgi:hypothetical protein